MQLQAVQAAWLECRSISGKEKNRIEGGRRGARGRVNRWEADAAQKESGGNNVREINARDAVTGRREQEEARGQSDGDRGRKEKKQQQQRRASESERHEAEKHFT